MSQFEISYRPVSKDRRCNTREGRTCDVCQDAIAVGEHYNHIRQEVDGIFEIANMHEGMCPFLRDGATP